jgi:hypothetical protein
MWPRYLGLTFDKDFLLAFIEITRRIAASTRSDVRACLARGDPLTAARIGYGRVSTGAGNWDTHSYQRRCAPELLRFRPCRRARHRQVAMILHREVGREPA